jgi:predicted site-specific integrase-resolvase
MQSDVPNLLTPRQLADTLKVCPVTLRRWTAAGRIPALVLAPRVVRYDLKQVLAALDRSPPASSEKQGRRA